MSQKQNDEEDESSSQKTNVKNFVCQQMNVNVLLLGTNNSTLNADPSGQSITTTSSTINLNDPAIVPTLGTSNVARQPPPVSSNSNQQSSTVTADSIPSVFTEPYDKFCSVPELETAIDTICKKSDYGTIKKIILNLPDDNGQHFQDDSYPLIVALVSSNRLKEDGENGLKSYVERHKLTPDTFRLNCYGGYLAIYLILYVQKNISKNEKLRLFLHMKPVYLVYHYTTLKGGRQLSSCEQQLRTLLNNQSKNIRSTFDTLSAVIFDQKKKALKTSTKPKNVRSTDLGTYSTDDDSDSVIYLGKKIKDIEKIELPEKGRKTVKVQMELTGSQLSVIKSALIKDVHETPMLRFSKIKHYVRQAEVAAGGKPVASVEHVEVQSNKRKRTPTARYSNV